MKQIKLTQGKFAIVDDADFERINSYGWFAMKTRYGGFIAARTSKCPQRKPIYMHRVVMNALEGKEVHHKNDNSLDNRKINLQVLEHWEHCCTFRNRKTSRTSKYKGVCFVKTCKRKKRWRATIKCRTKRICIGYFKTEIEAAQAYNQRAEISIGELARLNNV